MIRITYIPPEVCGRRWNWRKFAGNILGAAAGAGAVAIIVLYLMSGVI